MRRAGWMRQHASYGSTAFGNIDPGAWSERSPFLYGMFSAHLTQGVSDAVKATNTDVAVIPGGLTGILQPLDVSINKPFKDGLRKRWMHWMATEQYTFTAGGNMRAPPLPTQAQWVKESWDDVKVPVIKKSFKKCCISNAMDGTEDDILWEDIDESSEDESSGDDPAAAVDADTETNPYDDEIDVEDWQELFSGRHDDNNDDGSSDAEE